jgi:hypothetical protein
MQPRTSPSRRRAQALIRRAAAVRSAPITPTVVTPAAIHLGSSCRYCDAALHCPACDSDALQSHGLRIRDADSIGIRLFCEPCAEVHELHIESDKGRIFLSWR